MRTVLPVLPLVLLLLPCRAQEPQEDGSLLLDASLPGMRALLERYEVDRRALDRSYRTPMSATKRDRLRRWSRSWLYQLDRVDFDRLRQDERIDFLLLRNQLTHELRSLAMEEKRDQEVASLVPFAGEIVALAEARRAMKPIDQVQAAETLVALNQTIADLRKSIRADDLTAPTTVAHRAARRVDALRRTLDEWHGFYDGYDPLFTWWTAEPYKEVSQALRDYSRLIRDDLVGTSDSDAVVGDPIGDEALRAELAYEMIPYTPVELIQIANQEFAWCEREMRRAATDLGYSGDWKQALEHVKKLHVQPGEQPALIRELALEAINYVQQHELVTVPPLCREVWRMSMMSPERQKVAPYFLGGEVIQVSFPTHEMDHASKLMSLRGNNRHFARATVHHELVPGHHLQGFMSSRYRTHRRQFRTPFLIEGWALHWEMLLWDRGFQRSAEDRVGMLFWRAHRCARIIFSLNFHLERMTADECIEFLIERVGHERNNATAEVRRSVNGDYGPLYQAAYMLGGLQMRALHRQLVGSGRMSEREFHDAVLLENSIPLEMIRASLTEQPLSRDYEPSWRFYNLSEAESPTDADAGR